MSENTAADWHGYLARNDEYGPRDYRSALRHMVRYEPDTDLLLDVLSEEYTRRPARSGCIEEFERRARVRKSVETHSDAESFVVCAIGVNGV